MSFTAKRTLDTRPGFEERALAPVAQVVEAIDGSKPARDPLHEVKVRYINSAMAFGPVEDIRLQLDTFANHYDAVTGQIQKVLADLTIKNDKPGDITKSLADYGLTSISAGAIYQVLMHQLECPIKDSHLIEEFRTRPIAELPDLLREILVLREVSKEVQTMLENFDPESRPLLLQSYFDGEGDFISELASDRSQIVAETKVSAAHEALFTYTTDGENEIVHREGAKPTKTVEEGQVETELLTVNLTQLLNNLEARFGLAQFSLVEEFMDQGQPNTARIYLWDIASEIQARLDRGEGATTDERFDEPTG